MKKELFAKSWNIDRLVKDRENIEFPEFQREPNIWQLEKKERLIDSIVRGFDMSSIYFHKRPDGIFDCIDGQQRINAIWSFIGINEKDDDNGFFCRMSNEITEDTKDYSGVDKKKFERFDKEWKSKILNYEFNVVVFSDIKSNDDELNLQFIRLQLGAPLRGGEKLNAMTGAMRDFIFHKLVKFKFFTEINIQARRYAQHLVAAQIMINEFSRKEEGEFTRSRFEDIQLFVKEKSHLTAEDNKIIKNVENDLSIIEKEWDGELNKVNNRALAVSIYFFNSEQIEKNQRKEIKKFIQFFDQLIKTVRWQTKKGIDMDKEYKDLLRFQTYYSQASAEKYSLQGRHDFLREYFNHYKEKNEIMGDKEFKKNKRENPEELRQDY